MFRVIKYLLIFTLIVHVIHDTYVINTMEARVNDRLIGIDARRINGRLDSIDYVLGRMAKGRPMTSQCRSGPPIKNDRRTGHLRAFP
jgi:hypothetical protein